MSHPNEPHDPTQPLEQLPQPPSAGPATPPPARGGRFIGPRRTAILAGIAGLILGGLIGGGIAWAATDSSSGTTTAAAQPDSAHHKAAGTATKARKRHATVGTIAAVNGDSWTVDARDGAALTVTIDGTTAFGTAQKPAQRSDFAVGDVVAIAGKRDGTTVTATRVVKRPATTTATPTPAAPSGQPS